MPPQALRRPCIRPPRPPPSPPQICCHRHAEPGRGPLRCPSGPDDRLCARGSALHPDRRFLHRPASGQPSARCAGRSENRAIAGCSSPRRRAAVALDGRQERSGLRSRRRPRHRRHASRRVLSAALRHAAERSRHRPGGRAWHRRLEPAVLLGCGPHEDPGQGVRRAAGRQGVDPVPRSPAGTRTSSNTPRQRPRKTSTRSGRRLATTRSICSACPTAREWVSSISGATARRCRRSR